MSKKLAPLAFRPDEDVRAALEAEAADADRSMSWLINTVLRAHYGLEKPKPAKAKPKGK
jgi:hypothetical protein